MGRSRTVGGVVSWNDLEGKNKKSQPSIGSQIAGFVDGS